MGRHQRGQLKAAEPCGGQRSGEEQQPGTGIEVERGTHRSGAGPQLINMRVRAIDGQTHRQTEETDKETDGDVGEKWLKKHELCADLI